MIKVNVEDHIKKNLYYSATKPNLGPKKYTILKKNTWQMNLKFCVIYFGSGIFLKPECIVLTALNLVLLHPQIYKR